jgi:hypothetical protein
MAFSAARSVRPVTLELADPARSKTNKFVVKRGKVVIKGNTVVEITDP